MDSPALPGPLDGCFIASPYPRDGAGPCRRFLMPGHALTLNHRLRRLSDSQYRTAARSASSRRADRRCKLFLDFDLESWQYPSDDSPIRRPAVAERTTIKNPSSSLIARSAAPPCRRMSSAPSAAITWGALSFRSLNSARAFAGLPRLYDGRPRPSEIFR
jgi:hypothetical protein